MPCVNSKGQPVPGIQGQCPMGSTWRHPNGAEIEAGRVYDLPAGSYGRDDEGTSTGESTPGWFGRDQMSTEDINKYKEGFSMDAMMNRQPLMDKPDWMPDWGVDAGILAAGVLGGGRNPGSKKSMIEAFKNLTSKMSNPLKKTVQNKVQYKMVKPKWNGNQKQWEFQGRKIDPKTWNNGKGMNSAKKVRVGLTKPAVTREWSPWRVGTAVTGAGATGIQALMSSLSGKKDEEEAKKNAFINKSALENERLMEIEAYGGPRGSSAPEQKQTAMQKLGANMKNPEWWSESISGLPSDTRLMRLGQLMNYYGKRPKGRDAATDPAELWAANEIAHAKNVATAAGGSNSTFLSKFSSEDQDIAIRKEVENKLGINDWDPTTGPKGSNEDAVNTTVARVKGLIQEFVEKGMPWSEALTLAMTFVTEDD